ncbi:FmdB family zinc ribbon protein [Actinomycetospora flava]|uniref:Zinc ribbon domain-containing protein n=1 Tax=Actinomycetospora flava TaxID=3129232 RepID=A0ABU8M089_9PSEU
MATYAYRCPDCGTFDVTRPMGEAPERVECPRCAASSPRQWTAPLLAQMDPALRSALAREEKSRDVPEVVTRASGTTRR